ncbi:MAG: GTP-binding protein [Pedobacter sp.]|nr:MAG: GTP-binding protein [Pedobacter sp.]
MTVKISIRELHKSFSKKKILTGINLDIEDSKSTVIIGSSGSGKSVLLKTIIGLISSDSAAAHQVAMNQLRGGFSTELNVLRDQLIHFASMIELELDFAEEDVEFANRDQLQDLIVRINVVINKLIRSFELGNVIKSGINTVIAGRPNAGKSTLLNALLNDDRAIVSEIAGTTRDTIEEVLNIGGINFRLIDTAGIREATDTIEAIGVEKTMQKISQSALLVYLFDVVNLSVSEIKEDIASLHKPGVTMLAIANKIDLANDDRLRALQLPSDIKFMAISAKENQQVEELKQLIYESAVGDKLSDSHTMVTNIRHVEALQRTRTALDSVMNGLDNPVTSDFLAMDIKQALYYLGEITGQVTTDDLLENIFSKFCIGK